MCFGLPPACTLIAGGGFDYVVLPKGADELGAAGAQSGQHIGGGREGVEMVTHGRTAYTGPVLLGGMARRTVCGLGFSAGLGSIPSRS